MLVASVGCADLTHTAEAGAPDTPDVVAVSDDTPDVVDAAEPVDDAALDAPDVPDVHDAEDSVDVSMPPVDASGDVVPTEPLGARCVTAPSFSGTMTFTLEPARATETVPACGELGPARAVFLRTTVPARTRLTVATPEPSVALRLLPTCGASVCTTGAAFDPATRMLRWDNRGEGAVDAVVAVSAGGATPPPSVAVSTSLQALSLVQRCEEAPVLPPEGGEFVIPADEPSPSQSFCDSGVIATAYRAVDVQPGHALRVESVSPDTGVAIGSACAGGACLGLRDYLTANRSIRSLAAWRNDGSRSARVFIAASPLYGRTAPLTIRVRAAPSPPYARCDEAPTLLDRVLGVSLDECTELLTSIFGTSRPSLSWAVRVPARHQLVATATGANVRGLGLTLRDACASASLLAAAFDLADSDASAPPAARRELRWPNAGATERVVRLSAMRVERLAPAPFDLAVRFEPLPANARCEDAAPLDLQGATRVFPFTDAGNYTSDFCRSSPDPRSANFHRAVVPPGQRLELTSAASLRVLDGCTGTCLTTLGFVGNVAWTNTSSAPREVIVAALGLPLHQRASNEYSLRARLAPSVPASRCDTAPEVTPGATVSFAPRTAGEPVPACVASDTSPGLYYRVRVPARHYLRFRPESRDSLHPRLLSDCASRTCLWGFPEHNFSNNGATDLDLVLALPFTSFDAPDARFVVDVAPLPTNLRCDAAADAPVGVPLYVPGGFVLDPPRCNAPERASTLYYRVTVPPRSWLTAALMEGADGWVTAAESCLAPGCVVSRLSLNSRPFLGLNVSPATREMIVSVTAAGTVQFDAQRLAPEGACATAPTLRSGQSVTAFFRNAGELAPPCPGVPPGRVALHYAVEVPGGQTLTAQARCGENCYSLPTISIVDGCAPPICLPTTPSHLGGVEARAWRNNDPTTRRVLIAVSSSPTLPYEMSVALSVNVAP